MAKKRKKEQKQDILIVILMVIAGIFLLIHFSQEPEPQIEEGYIERELSQVIREIDQVPSDIMEQPYSPHMPELISNDINKMNETDEDVQVIYATKNRSIIMTIDKDSRDGNIEISVRTVADIWYLEDEHLLEEISIYQNETKDGLEIYGKDGENAKMLYSIKIHGDNVIS